MKRSIQQRFLSAFLALVLLISCCPVSYATETEPEDVCTVAETVENAIPETESAAEEITEMPEITESAEMVPTETEVQEQTDPQDTVPEETDAAPMVPEETVPAETIPEETVPAETVPEETVPAETVPEETVPEETTEETLPEQAGFVFPGMPETYVLSERELEKKQSMIENQVAEQLLSMTPGENYAADEIMVSAESQEEAEMMAAAFGGTLCSWSAGVALIQLNGATVVEAVTASLDPEQNLPAASPNHISRIIPVPQATNTLDLQLPEKQSWQTWVQENMTNPDPALRQPNGADYQWMHDAVDTYAAWGVTTGESWVKVAVIDSGVKADHEDLNGRVTTRNIGCGTTDMDGHGTHVAGIIAASMNNGRGGAGIAPGVSILSYRVCRDNGDIYTSDIIKAIRGAVNDGAHIINMSLSNYFYDYEYASVVADAIDAGVTIIAAMGNDASNTVCYPAAYEGVIGVSATNSAGTRVWYSNYGDWADVCAPGDNIYSTYNNGSYKRMGGTSMASPVVAGIAALYTSAVGYRIAPAEMEKALEKAAAKVSDKGVGAGQVNAANMFGGVPNAPFYFVASYDGNYTYNEKYEVPCESYLVFCESKDLAMYGESFVGDMNGVLVYTLDGKNPAVKNGQVTYGSIAPEPGRLDLAAFAGETVTVKAAFVNGMGVMGKVVTAKIRVSPGNRVKSVTIIGPSKMQAGKSVTLTATVTAQSGAPAVDQSVYWEIDQANTDPSMRTAKIDGKTGKLTTPSGRTGKIRVKAYSIANSNYFGSLTINVRYITPVAKLTLGTYDEDGTLWIVKNPYTYVGASSSLVVASMEDKYGLPIDPTISGVSWSSSNPKVATIDRNGNIRALSKGNTTISCTSLDGSNKKATVKLTVKQQVERLEIVANNSVAPGGSITLKANLYPANADNKKVGWRIENNPDPGRIHIDYNSGKVTVGKNAREGTTFTVTATTTDDDAYKLVSRYTIEIVKPCTKVWIDTNALSAGYATGPVYDNKGNLKTVELFSVDLPDSSGVENQIVLDGHAYNGSSLKYFYAGWTSSDSSVASVDGLGNVTAHKAGTAKITMTARDGSNKKATVTVKVNNPVSSMSIASNALQMSNYEPYVAIGKSVKNTVNFADTYGKPTNQKVIWDFTVAQYNRNDKEVTNGQDWTSFFRNTGLISVKNGILTVKPGVRDNWGSISGEFRVTVYATAMDRTTKNVTTSKTYLILPLTTYMAIDRWSKTLSVPSYSSGEAYFCSDQHNAFFNTENYGFTATSSNPKVASAVYIEPDPDNPYLYKVVFSTPGKTGTATITITAADGSNKKCSFTVKVPY